jgi:hypothetical protein
MRGAFLKIVRQSVEEGARRRVGYAMKQHMIELTSDCAKRWHVGRGKGHPAPFGIEGSHLQLSVENRKEIR